MFDKLGVNNFNTRMIYFIRNNDFDNENVDDDDDNGKVRVEACVYIQVFINFFLKKNFFDEVCIDHSDVRFARKLILTVKSTSEEFPTIALVSTSVGGAVGVL